MRPRPGSRPSPRATADRIEESFTLLPRNDVVDDDGRPPPPAAPEPGSLARTEHLALGYYRDEVATARVFRHGPLGRFAVTGDAVRKGADGTIALLGREATCINTGGEKVFALAGYKVPKRYIAVGRIERLVSGKPDYRWAQERATC